MTAPNLRTVGGTAIAVVIASAMLLGSVFIALRPNANEVLAPFSKSSLLDYSSRVSEAFVPLSTRFAGAFGFNSADGGSASRRAGTRSSLGSLRPERIIAEHPFTNDNFEDAKQIPSLPYTAKTKSNAASRQQGEPTGCASAGGTAWYRYAPKEDVALVSNTFGTSYATSVRVFTGTRLSDLKLIACDTDVRGNSQAGFPAQAGEIYYFQVTSPAGGGDLIFSVEPIGVPSLVSVSTSGVQGDGWSQRPSISRDGRYVAFASWATNLVPGLRQAPCPSAEGRYLSITEAQATSSAGDRRAPTVCSLVFVRDRLNGTTTLVSKSSTGDQANDASGAPSISPDGRYVAFESLATNLDGTDTNGVNDIFVHDIVARVTSKVSVSPSGGEARSPAFSGFLEARRSGSLNPSISSNGRFVAFQSWADNLVPGDNNGATDVFVRDRAAGETKRVSISRGMSSRRGEWYGKSPDISSDGRFVALQSAQDTGTDGVDVGEVFLQDLRNGETTRVSVSSSGEVGNGNSDLPSVSDDGRFVVFSSRASNFVAPDMNTTWDLYVRDLAARTTTRISLPSSGTVIQPSSISADGRYIAYNTDANELDPGETNGRQQTYLYDVLTQTTILISASAAGKRGGNGSTYPSISADGRLVAFQSQATNLVSGDSNGVSDIYVFERP